MRNIFMIALATTAVVAVACSETVDMGDVTSGNGTPIFQAPVADGGDASSQLDANDIKELQCISTECPAPWATCLSNDGPAYKCGTDLTRDNKNCGACGNECLEYKPLNMRSRCVDSACELECYTEPNPIYQQDFRNCNALLDDGCESDVVHDANNCGACGNKCAAGTKCIDGKCGCPPNTIECFGMCVDPQTDDNHCGGCGNFCEPFPAEDQGGCAMQPTSTYFGCREGKCGALKCMVPSADCNGDLGLKCSSDGCEVGSIVDDNNCGACGNKCTGDKHCVDEGNGPECAVPCARFGMTLCPQGCFDILNDPTSCGSCNAPCRPAGPNQTTACEKGVCAYDCKPGFADCNGDPSDGCETNLKNHPANCGACGNACNLAAGQPCIEGKCLTTACEAGTTR